MTKFINLFLLIAFLQAPSGVFAQEISLSLQNVSISTAFSAIEKQSGFHFIYSSEALGSAQKVSLQVQHATLEQVLDICFKDQPLAYVREEYYIIVKPKSKKLIASQIINGHELKGKVTNDKAEALESVTVAVKGKKQVTLTDRSGVFFLSGIEVGDILLVSSVGYENRELPVAGRTVVSVVLKLSENLLDETVVKGYYNTTKRLNTGNVSKMSANEISQQPVANPLAALEGRMPGIFVTQTSGLPGTDFSVLIRGRNSITSGNEPLYLIDGLPFTSGTLDNLFLGYTSKQSPFNSINPEDIESIEVLKDADATAIYGSRGANGVILITTKKGKPGKTKVELNFYTGSGKVTRQLPFMNTQQYLEMRHEAFKNDNRTPTASTAYDFLVWDTSRYTDWQQLLIGGRASELNAQASISGGNEHTQFLVGANLHRETTVFPGNFSDTKSNVHVSLHHTSTDKRFQLAFGAAYSSDKNNLISNDLYTLLNIIPNAPPPYDSNGKLVWSDKGISFNNPFGYLLQTYTALTTNLISNASLQYQLWPNLSVHLNLGYGDVNLNQTQVNPKSSQNPANNPVSYSNFGTNGTQNWIAEPQLNYLIAFNRHKVEALIGSNWQDLETKGTQIIASNYSNDALLSSLTGAATTSISSNQSVYRYQGFYGRLNYNFDNKYLINITGRRDGSSRFGPGRQYANFGAAGVAWVFSDVKWIKRNLLVLSFGKLRASYGSSGNDKIGDYKYLDTWTATTNPYAGIGGLQPNALFNPDYAWEISHKIEGAVELGFFKDRLYISASYYLNRSNNQLLFYSLPAQTGSTGITSNLPAEVENKGWEFELQGTPIKAKYFKWRSSLNLTIGVNKLIAYPGLAGSTFANTYVIGQALNILKLFHYTGLDPKSGVYQFSGTTAPADRTSILNTNPALYGGWYNEISYKGIQLSFLFQFTKQKGLNYYARNINGSVFPGSRNNEPAAILQRWQQPGDVAPFQMYTTSSANAAPYYANTYYAGSDAVISDGSYIRLKTVSLSYDCTAWLRRIKFPGNATLYLSAQNLLTLTHYFGFDPENMGLALPPLRVMTIGIKISF